jgi:hypothetical protein
LAFNDPDIPLLGDLVSVREAGASSVGVDALEQLFAVMKHMSREIRMEMRI